MIENKHLKSFIKTIQRDIQNIHQKLHIPLTLLIQQ